MEVQGTKKAQIQFIAILTEGQAPITTSQTEIPPSSPQQDMKIVDNSLVQGTPFALHSRPSDHSRFAEETTDF